ncbi:hypothetical protein ES703_109530 [subsurface metagenome]
MIPFLYGHMVDLAAKYSELSASIYNMGGKLDSAGYYIGIQNWASAEAQLEAAKNYARDAADEIYKVGSSIHYWTWKAFESINDFEFPEAEPLTMEALLDLLWKSTKLETYFFVNYIDSMRASIWNIKIDPSRLDELYRHFTE